ncbi:class I adenylate-forming enzyme family protein [Pseudonocardia spinosispora]|uniref:class I adenylate-forming enzyme family protein n=1 Tax=Pseudonocardia spinosispora TaxID=103441 RepID=UPI000684D374|nr:class I adenylate-forming enzyme family protein [Pseudonocardia spinosispora]
MSDTAEQFEWGTAVERRTGPVPFLSYSPRRHHVVELLDDAARWSSRTHLIQGDRRLSFADVFSAADRVAARFHQAGLRPGDRLLLLAPNSPEWVISLWAGLKLGAVVALGNGWWSGPLVEHAVGLIAPRLVLADEKRAALVPTSDDCTVIGLDEVRDTVNDTSADSVHPAAPDGTREDDPAVIIFTAGTTGAPKPVVLAHRSVIANLHNLLVMSRRLPQQVDGSRPPAVSLQSGPLFHIGGLQSLLLALLGGNTLVFLEGRFDPEQVLDLVERERITWWGAVPTMASRVLEHPSITGRDLTSVRSVSMGGAPVQPALMARLREAFPNAGKGMSTIYGMTETGGTVAAASGATMADNPRTAGAPLPVVELRIDSPNAEGDGEIVVRTPGQMVGYWGGAQADLVDDEGWVHTGDQGRLVDGLLYITGRIKDLIIRGGENIAPAHVEAVLLKHPAVRNVAVLGLPDEDLGERVAAAVQVLPGSEVSQSDLAEFVAAELASYERPAQWWLRTEELPMHDSGKTDKLTLRKTWPAF